MPLRLVVFIIILLIIVTFIGFNIENRSDIRFWFGDGGLVKDVPIFLSLFVMYILGVFSVIPSVIVWMVRNKRENKMDNDNTRGKNKENKDKKSESLPPASDGEAENEESAS